MGQFARIDASSVSALFGAAVAADPTRPLLTYYDDATGERTELSGTTLDNWVAKTANLLVDGSGVGTGDRAVVALPPHWQSAAVLLGCWSAGLALTDAHPVDVAFADLEHLDTAADATDRFVLGLAPMALPLRQVPAGFVDYVIEVRGHGDVFRPYAPTDPASPALAGGTTHAELCAAARNRADALGMMPGDRVLLDTARHHDPVDWLLAPLAAGASIVLCAHLDPAKLSGRVAAERVTRTLDA